MSESDLLNAALEELAGFNSSKPCEYFAETGGEQWEACADICAYEAANPDCWRRYLETMLEGKSNDDGSGENT
jgi:hypothetical protein